VLSSNQNGKVVEYDSICSECQGVVEQFMNAAKNPSKMSAMKKTFSAFCQGITYEQECKLLISKLDFFTTKLSDYLEDSENVCSNINMCSETDFDGIRRIFLLTAKKYLNKIDGTKSETCDECQFAAHELLQILDKSTQNQLQTFVSGNLCANLGQYRSTCNMIANQVLPKMFQEIQTVLTNSQQFCVDLKLCLAKEVNIHRLTANEVKSKLMGPKYVENLLQSLRALKTPEPHQLDMSCSECQIFNDMVLDTLKTSEVIQGLSGILELVLCTILPQEWGCTDFVNTYGQTVVYMTVQQVDSESLCETFKMCTNDSMSLIAKHSKAELLSTKCSSCESLSSFLQVEMTKPKAKTEIVYGLQNMICQEAPHSLYNICENYVGGLLPGAYDAFLYFLQGKQVCQTIKAC